MKYWFRGKRGGFLVFLVIAGLVAGGLGWVTLTALRLEKARAEADLANKLMLAMWRLDSRIFTDFARESSQPYRNYSIGDTAFANPPKDHQALQKIAVCELAPVPGNDAPPWMGPNYIVAPNTSWKSSQALREMLIRHLSLSNRKPQTASKKPTSLPVPEEIANGANLEKLLTQVNPPEGQPSPLPPNSSPTENAQQEAFNSLNSTASNSQVFQGKGGKAVSRDTELRVNRGQMEQQGAYKSKEIENTTRKRDDQVVVVLGSLTPLWLTGGPEAKLALARAVQIGPNQAYQVTLVDWPALEALLAEEIRDLFPEARFRPVLEGEESALERTMTALPVEFEPGPPVSGASELRRSPLGIGLLLAWAAALVALLAVGLGGWSLLDLSERRIRFVSAVTHELRTPLTTLRLYLDMLAGGMVKEEKQKEEYLQTLNTEADRLNRLVGNVLDFSRLENQRPRLTKTQVSLNDLLEQVRSTWQGRCESGGKELIVENSLGNEAMLYTDCQLVQQVLGNLIDNACKYSREAEDRHIWLRARCEGHQRLILEVEDRGPGVPPRERQSIFRPFRRGRNADVTGGVGLGLALAHRWAKLLGGNLTLHCRPGKVGACFRFELAWHARLDNVFRG
jgi:signal transduction histidine kinase